MALIGLVCLVTITLYICYKSLVRSNRSTLPLPPGPTLLNPGAIPQKEIWLTFRKWHQEHGPIVSLKLGVQTIIILGSHRIARDLLDKRGSLYSTHIQSVYVNKYIAKGLQPVFMEYGPEWKLHRRLHTTFLSPQFTRACQALLDTQSKKTLHRLLSTNDFGSCFHHYVSNVMFNLAYGKDVDEENKSDQEHMDKMFESLTSATSVMTFLVDIFPILDRLPKLFSRWKANGERSHNNVKNAFIKCIQSALQQDTWNWSKEAFSRKESKDFSLEQLAFSIGEVYIAGSHTTDSTLRIAVMASLLYPDAMRQAQRELDQVVGSQRLPSFEDQDKLPYVNAFISEVLRWRPMAPVGGPRTLSEDDEYMGYFLPAGATIIANQWEMDMDESIFEDAPSFKPERWIQNPDLPLSAFGFGRRICPGQYFARSSLFIAIARMLWAYDIDCPVTSTLEDVKAADRSENFGVIFTLPPFEASFRVRSPERQQIIEQGWQTANKDCNDLLKAIGHDAFTPTKR
ncbi:cytochrome P450 [Aspergillus pseudotamarii]|uniref:Cytochrome P450 n=1 Tax=Aspergillus pseudotamarii TaxID=132259 RepID=A0A5N6SGL6_ASPPS|nr:cytochrome P450 [Aspergillus pseudotamarii]KAE8133812.1 cytochrome P450 [Aspergillus pseudotamarii]